MHSVDVLSVRKVQPEAQSAVLPDKGLLDLLPAAVYTTDIAGRITYFNEAAAEFWGVRPELGTSQWCGSWKLFWPDGTPMRHDECPMATAIRERRAIRGLEAIAERPDGTRIPFIPFPTPLFTASGDFVGAVNMLVDIGERKSSELARQRLAAIVEFSSDAIISKNLDGIIVSWNHGAERLFGYRPEEAIGKPVTMLIPADRQAEEPKILERIRRGERVEHYETVRRRKDGSLIDISLTVSPVRNDEGRIVGASKIARDITEQKRSQVRLAMYAEEQAALYQLTDRLHRARKPTDIYDAALDAILRALCCQRAAVLRFDGAGVMRFVAWRGLSDEYRQAVEGHSPWAQDAVNPQPLWIGDVDAADMPEGLRTTVKSEGIRALSFIPIECDGRLIGKFMTYYDEPHAGTRAEIDLAVAVARQIGFSVGRIHADTQRSLLVAELSHRVKNTLATVISIAQQSFSKGPSAEAALQSFDQRIRGLAKTHDRLAERNWLEADLEAVLLDELAPYRRADGRNVRASGPRVSLGPKSAVMLGMAFHELATNAAKHGALSVPAGAVDVNWEVLESRRLRIHWIERDGPPVRLPQRSGFGRLLLERALVSDLNGHVTLKFAGSGLQCEIVAPLDSIAGSD